ncbi:unnamed protein product [Peronospora belbahrii]|uniref:Uncharacterized protein n=1 Tax=Peronospora belbahrii TaxID=622444 RepID=A0AAU9LHT6_9STRA|nr:unnamed protein product [Peronospora belbahrii]CAH0514620.1 unnamed protein product [Peronospora belbahrii]
MQYTSRPVVASISTFTVVPNAETSARSTRCRYKTGRCLNLRAVKANGTLLLLCQHHRNQQNRTKKRSDMKCRQNRAKKRQTQREKLHKKQSLVVPDHQERSILSWSATTLPLTSIVASHMDEHVASTSLTMTDSEKVFESTSPTAVDFNVSLMNWVPRSMSPGATPAMQLEDSSFALEDMWLLEYFIL